MYLPCLLASKKRYVGHMYESPKDLKPTFDAKVRRDEAESGDESGGEIERLQVGHAQP